MDLQNTLNNILQDKDANLLPENLKVGITCLGVDGTMTPGIDTSDATATASDILVGKTAYVNGVKIVGTIADYEKIDFSNNNYELIGNDLHIKSTTLCTGYDNIDDIPVFPLPDATVLAMKKYKDNLVIALHSYSLNPSQPYNQRAMQLIICVPQGTAQPYVTSQSYSRSIVLNNAYNLANFGEDPYVVAANEKGPYDYSTNPDCLLEVYKIDYTYKDGSWQGKLNLSTSGKVQIRKL